MQIGLASPVLAQSAATPQEQALWQQAVALMKAEQPESALPLLDRLVSIAPDTHEYRLELGFALLKVGQYGRARYQLDRSRAGNTNPVQVAAANRLISVAEARRIFSGYFNLNVRPETNPGKQTDLTSVDIFGLPFAVANAPGSTSLIVTAGGAARPHIAENLRWRFSVDTWSRLSDEKILRDHILSFRSGPIFSFNNNGQAEIGILARRRWNADELYNDSRGFYANLGLPIGDRAYLMVRGGRETLEFFNGSIPRAQRTVGLQLNVLASASILLRGSLDLAVTDAAFPSVAGRNTEVRLGIDRSFPNGLDVRADLWHRTDHRDGPDRVFGVTRRDSITGLEFGVSKRDLRLGRFLPEIVVGADQGKSNIAFFDYDNRYINLRLRTNF